MKRLLRLFCIILLLTVLSCPLFAEIMQSFEIKGLKNIERKTIDDIVYSYRGKEYSDDLFIGLLEEIYNVPGVELVDYTYTENNMLYNFTFEIYEMPMVGSISFSGNSVVKKTDIQEAMVSVKVGDFYDADSSRMLQLLMSDLSTLYKSKGFEGAKFTPSVDFDEETNKLSLSFDIEEGVQKRVVEIAFEGNEKFADKELKSIVKTKVKTLFNSGYLDPTQIETDKANLEAFYAKNGYIDAIVSDIRQETVVTESDKPKNYEEIKLVFVVEEHEQWTLKDLEVTGNNIFTTEEIMALNTVNPGDVADIEKLNSFLVGLQDLYTNVGYIFVGLYPNEEKDEEKLTVSYLINIVENEQASVGEVRISGLTKSKEYVFEREISLKTGNVFSKADLVSSYQNLYNTGLLKNLDYQIYPSQDGKTVDVEFILEEGNQMDIQFGATFGGNISGFPISGFLQWNDKNLFGQAKTLSIGTTLSPDTQSASISLSDGWVGNKRWSNSISLSFSRNIVVGAMQQGIGSPRDNENDDNKAYPLGYSSYAEYAAAGFATPGAAYLMKYDLLGFDLGYTTGYTFVLDKGRLSASTGISFGLDRAYYDKTKYNPFENIIYKYGQKWQWTNSISLSLQWDGRDLIYYTTKGYVISQSFTYSGGFLGGLSNYIKSTTSFAWYRKLFSINTEEGPRNGVLGFSTSFNMMLNQFYKAEGESKPAWHPAKMGATKYEMLYIDGMTTARGFDTITGQSVLWDNTLELGYPLVQDVINAEAFVSATGISKDIDTFKFNDMKWYMATGIGIKLKISGFPLGLYLVKNATFNVVSPKAFDTKNCMGNLFGGTKLVLAISTSLI